MGHEVADVVNFFIAACYDKLMIVTHVVRGVSKGSNQKDEIKGII
jgi:hypothetical protein